jgi:hypothetical protein
VTRDSLMASVDPLAELQRASQTSHARYEAQSARLGGDRPSHLDQRVQVGRVERRMAEITSPSDRLALSAEERTPTGHYVQVQQRPTPSAAPVVSGRLQDPVSAHLPRERHIYEHRARGAPSYPREAGHFNSTISSGSMSSPEVFGQIRDAMMVEPLAASSSEAEQRHVLTTANIVGVAESRRDDFMGLTSAQTIAQAAEPESALTPTEVFGRHQPARGSTRSSNLPGLLPASGTGATAQFRDFHSDITAGRTPTSAHGSRLFENISQQHSAMMESGYSQESVDRLRDDGMSEEFIAESQMTRMRSAATREPAMMTGQLPYRLRTLRGPRRASSSDSRFSPY